MTQKIKGEQIQGGWVTYSGTVTGFSSFTGTMRYKLLAGTCIFEWSLVGTSNAVGATIALPFSAVGNTYTLAVTGDSSNYIGAAYIETSMTELKLKRGGTTPFTNWASSGSKSSNGTIIYEVA